jgi:molybdate transport system substrate-binding protein
MKSARFIKRKPAEQLITISARRALCKNRLKRARRWTFSPARARQMDELFAKNLIETETRRDFARNTLVLIVPQDSKTNIQSFADLGKPEVRRVAIGNPKTVPAGQYAEECEENLSF